MWLSPGALARDPAVLLLDEPFSAVDQVTRRNLRRELVQLRKQVRVPIVLVTHDLDEAVMLADQMVVLHRGRSLQVGTPADVMNRPRDAEVARLVDQRNLFQGEVLGHRSDARRSRTLLGWLGYILEARFTPTFSAGSRVDWLVPAGSIVLHRRDLPSSGEYENPVRGRVTEMLVFGDTAEVLLHVDGINDGSEAGLLAFNVPAHVATQSRVTAGEPVTVSLLADGVHIMPPKAAQGEDGESRSTKRDQRVKI